MHRAKLWAGAAMCAAQFLSGLCPSRVLAVNRSRPVRLITSRIFPLCPRKRTYLPILELLPPPALRERSHRGLACRLVAMRWPTVFVMAEGQCPHPRRTNRRGVDLKDAADNITVGQHIVIVITPLTGRSARRGTPEDQIVLVHFTEPTCGASC